jgi:hypothetical protein
MSKNIYRVNKKSDLDEIMKNNFLKPICIIFVSKSMDKKLYDDVATSIKAISKQLTYSMILIIDFDDFIDNMNFFTTIKENVPNFIAYFKGKQMANCSDKDNFIPLIISLMDQIHGSYVNRLMNAFNQQTEQTDKPEQPDKPEQTEQTDKPEQPDKQVKQEELEKANLVNTDQVNIQVQKQLLNQESNKSNKSRKSSKKSNKKVVKESSESSSSSEQSAISDEDEDEDEDDDEDDEDDEEDAEDAEDEEVEDSDKQSVHVETRKKTNNSTKISVHEDNTTEDIRLKKEKLKELKKLKEQLNK